MLYITVNLTDVIQKEAAPWNNDRLNRLNPAVRFYKLRTRAGAANTCRLRDF